VLDIVASSEAFLPEQTFNKSDISETTEQEIPEVSQRYHVNATLMNSPLSAGVG